MTNHISLTSQQSLRQIFPRGARINATEIRYSAINLSSRKKSSIILQEISRKERINTATAFFKLNLDEPLPPTLHLEVGDFSVSMLKNS
jgi:hypothetical protein